jgi:glyoxylase-like metal-dependent hydrolase (beta-lactamase superfamily II)/rhodanese-related sulfurtransferase
MDTLKNTIMKIEQIYTGCLAQGAYYIVSENEAVIIDPLRETDPYIKRAEEDGVKIKYILETHFHADFVSGHVDLAKKTGATIIYGPNANPSYPVHLASDGEIIKFGKLSIKVLHTPGHTMESTCFLLLDETGKETALFSGDTLFIGDVGRPDLAQKAETITQEELAGLLFHSLRTKIMNLPDDVVVYPAHGAGSACGKNMSKETTDLLGNQKKTNYALRENMTESEFVKEVTDGLLPPPGYFGMNVAMNKQGYDEYETVLKRGLNSLSIQSFETILNDTDDILVLDTRNASEFANSFIPGSISIGLEGQFAPWVGALIPDVKQKIALVTEIGKEEETIRRLSRVGYDNVIGYLEGGIENWKSSGKETDSIERISAQDLEKEINTKSTIIDVRKPGEFQAEHIENVPNIPLDYLNEHMQEFPKNEPFILHCAGGYRSIIAASILKSRGYNQVKDVIGGYAAISKTNIKRTNFVCPSTLK